MVEGGSLMVREMAAGADPGPALVLSGGAAMGAVQVGVLRALFARGFRPSLIVGTSVGALNAAFIAFHPDEEGLLKLEEIWKNGTSVNAFDRNPLKLAYNLAFQRHYLFDNRFLRKLLTQHLPVDDFSATRVPLYITATNLTKGVKHVFNSGLISRAVLASTAIPGFLRPVRINGDLYVDGGVVANLDLATAVELGAKRILAVDIAGPGRFVPPGSLLGVFSRSIDLMTRQIVNKDLELLKERAQISIIQVSTDSKVWMGDFSHTAEIIKRAEEIGRKMVACCIDAAGRLVPGVVSQLELELSGRITA